MVLGLGFAILIDQKIRAESAFRSIFLYPMALSFIVTGTAWKWLLDPGVGLERSMHLLGWESFSFGWIKDSDMAIYCVVIAAVWQTTGFVMAMFLAGLRGVDTEQVNAAQVDGARTWQIYLRIIMPQLGPVFVSAFVILADANGLGLSVLLGNGDGTFQSAISYQTGGGATSVAVSDFNGDGKSDLAVSVGLGVSVFLGKGDGMFGAAMRLDLMNYHDSVAVGDMNGDGVPDLIVGGSGTSVLVGKGDGTFGPALNSARGYFSSAAVADFNGDGKLDVVGIDNSSYMWGAVSVWLNISCFAGPTSLLCAAAPPSLFPGRSRLQDMFSNPAQASTRQAGNQWTLCQRTIMDGGKSRCRRLKIRATSACASHKQEFAHSAERFSKLAKRSS